MLLTKNDVCMKRTFGSPIASDNLESSLISLGNITLERRFKSVQVANLLQVQDQGSTIHFSNSVKVWVVQVVQVLKVFRKFYLLFFFIRVELCSK